MRFFKRLLTFALVSLGVASFATAQSSTMSADEVRARQLLEEKTRELEAAPRPQPVTPAAPSEKDLKAQEKARKQAEETAKAAEQKRREEQERQDRINKIKADLAAQGQAVPAPVAKPVVIVPAPKPPAPVVQFQGAEADARALLEQKTRELEATPPAAVAPPVAAPAPTVVVTQPQPVAPARAATVAVPITSDDPTRALLEQRTRDTGGTTPPPAPARTAATSASTKSTSSKQQVVAPVVQVPEVQSPLPTSKQQRLADLLETYRLNLITPADYHSARAKILAEP